MQLLSGSLESKNRHCNYVVVPLDKIEKILTVVVFIKKKDNIRTCDFVSLESDDDGYSELVQKVTHVK